MKRLFYIGLTMILFLGLIALTRRSGGDSDVRDVIEQVQTATLDGLNRHNPDALDPYFATVVEGAQANGLAETQDAYKNFIAQMSTSDSVQFHSFNIEDVEVHEEAGLAKVTYRLHFSLIRNGIAIFTAKVKQNVALLKTSRGWLISGGDTPQLSDVTGSWPSR